MPKLNVVTLYFDSSKEKTPLDDIGKDVCDFLKTKGYTLMGVDLIELSPEQAEIMLKAASEDPNTVFVNDDEEVEEEVKKPFERTELEYPALMFKYERYVDTVLNDFERKEILNTGGHFVTIACNKIANLHQIQNKENLRVSDLKLITAGSEQQH